MSDFRFDKNKSLLIKQQIQYLCTWSTISPVYFVGNNEFKIRCACKVLKYNIGYPHVLFCQLSIFVWQIQVLHFMPKFKVKSGR